MSTQVEERAPRLAVGPRRARMRLGLSVLEIVGIVVALLAFAASLFYYFTALGPEKSRLRAQEQELRRIQGELGPQVGSGGSGARGPNVRDTLASLESFRNGYLKPLGAGRIALINEVNALAKKHNVVLTSGIDMPLDKGATRSDEGDKNDKKGKKKDDVFAVFPRLDMHFTVFGQYKDQRAFLNDLEHNKQFFVIKSVGFVMQEEKSEGGGRRGARAATSGSGLAMTIEASAYFQR